MRDRKKKHHLPSTYVTVGPSCNVIWALLSPFYSLCKVLTVVAGLGFEPSSPEPLSSYHCLLMVEGHVKGVGDIPFQLSRPGSCWELLMQRSARRKHGAPGQLARAGPHHLASCHHQVLDQAGCVLQRHLGHCVSCGKSVRKQSVRFH